MVDVPLWQQAISDLKFQDLSDVQTVGIGLYLALAVIQALSATGLSGLRRRIETLRNAVTANKVTSMYTQMHSLRANASRLEIGLHSFNRTLLFMGDDRSCLEDCAGVHNEIVIPPRLCYASAMFANFDLLLRLTRTR